MEIREARVTDIETIVALLKVSLGESLMPKSEQYWQWKHVRNPFGPSPVLLCWEGNELIGVRAFMRWQWINKGKVFSAVRAVDTATHPAHQGKGIFKKLTLQLVDYCKGRGDDFVFNTPNKQSKPGYLKMKWVEAGKLPVRVSVQKPFTIAANLVKGIKPGRNTENDSIDRYLNHPGLDSLVLEHQNLQETMTTRISSEYIKWRYRDVPVARYVAVGEEHGGDLTGLIIGRIKKTRIGTELRITDCLVKQRCGGAQLMDNLKQLRKEMDIDYTTWSGVGSENSRKLFRGLAINLDIGPIVTIRSLGMTDLSALDNFNKWSPSLGDLELF